MFLFLRLLIFSLFLLTACGQAVRNPTPSIDQSSSSAVTPTKPVVLTVSPTRQETRIPSTATKTSTLQKTSAPTASKRSPTPYRTNLPTPIPTETPVWYSQLFNPSATNISPDGMWIWEQEPGYDASGKQLEITHFVRVDGKSEWRVQPNVEEVGDWPSAYYEPIFWSPNEPYVFLVGHVCCFSGPGSAYIHTSLVRLNLNTGYFSRQVPWGSFHSFSFSPTGRYMNRATVWEHSLHITRLFDGRVIEIKLPERYHDFGAGHWSPDGKRFVVYVCETDNPSEQFCQKYPILLFEPETKSYQVIVEDTPEGYLDYEWIDATHFQLKNLDSTKTKIFDAETGAFLP